MTKTLRINDRPRAIKFSGNVSNGKIEIEIEDNLNDYYAYAYLNKLNLIALKKHIDEVLKDM